MALHYIEAGKILDKLLEPNAKPASLKKLLYGSPDPSKKVSISAVFALVSETLKYKQILDEIIDMSDLMSEQDLRNQGHIIHVMLFDLLIGERKTISGAGKTKKIIQSHQLRLSSELKKYIIKKKIKDIADLIPDHLKIKAILPRWVRVNLLLTTLDFVLACFDKEGWKEIPFTHFFETLDNLQYPSPSLSCDSSSKKPAFHASKLMGKVYCKDAHIPGLLAFPPQTDLHDHKLLHAGHIVLQDKASALSGYALQAPADPDTVALDACAAPGQKTSQVAQSMMNFGKLFAFDLDKYRLETLKKLCKRNGLKNLTAVNGSFLEIDTKVEPFSEVEYILLDPSCSGSGIINRLDYAMTSDGGTDFAVDEGKDRILKLQEFQLSMIAKAFTFPNLKRLIYSTCSIHDEENEQVVEKALTLSDQFKASKVLPDVSMRGKAEYPHGECCIRTIPSRDHTIGFFVAMFERKDWNPSTKKRKKPTPTPDTADFTTFDVPTPTKKVKLEESPAEERKPAPAPTVAAIPPPKPKLPATSYPSNPQKHKKNKPKKPGKPLMR